MCLPQTLLRHSATVASTSRDQGAGTDAEGYLKHARHDSASSPGLAPGSLHRSSEFCLDTLMREKTCLSEVSSNSNPDRAN